MKRWEKILIPVCLFLMFFNRFFPPMFGLNATGTSVIFLFVPTMVLLLTVDMIWPALAGILAFAVSGVYTFTDAVSRSLGSNIFWLVALSGMVISVLGETGVIRRVALWFISRPIVHKSPWFLVAMLFLATLVIGSVTDPTALILIMSVLTEEICTAVGQEKGSRMGMLMMVGVLIMDGISTGITPIGHPVPILVMGLFKDIIEIDFFRFTVAGYVIGLLMMGALLLAMRFLFKMDVTPLKNFNATSMYKELGPMTKRAKWSVAIYGCVVALWLLPSLLQRVLPEVAGFINDMSITAPLAAAIVAMCLIRVDGKPLMDIEKAFTKGAPWSACFIVGIALLLGGSLSNPEAGIVDALTKAGESLGVLPPLIFVIVILLLDNVLTNVSSDTLTATLMATITVALVGSGIISGINIPALSVILCVMNSSACATPPASAFSAIVAGSGWVKPKELLTYAGGFSLIEALLLATAGYFIVGWIV